MALQAEEIEECLIRPSDSRHYCCCCDSSLLPPDNFRVNLATNGSCLMAIAGASDSAKTLIAIEVGSGMKIPLTSFLAAGS